MKRVIILYEEINETLLKDNSILLRELWETMGYEVRELIVREGKSPDLYMNELVNLKAEFLITFAMAGFAWGGLMEQARFNNLLMMQIHILIGNLPFYDFFLKKEYGLQCFFFTDSRDIYSDWKKKYVGVPFMEYIPTLYVAGQLTEEEREFNRENLQTMIKRVMAFIKEPSVL